MHRAARFAVEIDKAAPALLTLDQREAALHRAALQTRHAEAPALRLLAGLHRRLDPQRLRQNFIAVVIGSALRLIEIETGGENALIAVLGAGTQRVLPLPGLNDDRTRQRRVVDLVPADHLPLVLLEDLFQLLVEVGLQRMGIRQPVLLHKRLNRRRRPPLAGVNFVAADVQIGIGKIAASSPTIVSTN